MFECSIVERDKPERFLCHSVILNLAERLRSLQSEEEKMNSQKNATEDFGASIGSVYFWSLKRRAQ
jgi:hypothetical protein